MRVSKLTACFVFVLWAVAAGGGPAAAHEFWVAPERYVVEPGDRIVATLRNGEMMRGEELPYITPWFHAFTVTSRDGTRKVDGFDGDMPALSMTANEPGLYVIAYHSAADRVTYDDGERFRRYLAYEGLDGVAEAHRERGLPETGFAEEYTRFAKALVQVGPATEDDRDAPLGLRFELVAGANPYASGAETLTVTLLRRGEPVAGRQIAVFRCAGAVTRTLATTNARGQATIPIVGGGVFLLNAVDIRPTEPDAAETDGVAWTSDWASLTFGPGKTNAGCPGAQ